MSNVSALKEDDTLYQFVWCDGTLAPYPPMTHQEMCDAWCSRPDAKKILRTTHGFVLENGIEDSNDGPFRFVLAYYPRVGKDGVIEDRMHWATWVDMNAYKSTLLLRVCEVTPIAPEISRVPTYAPLETLNENAVYELQCIDGTPAPFPPMTPKEMRTTALTAALTAAMDKGNVPLCRTSMGFVVAGSYEESNVLVGLERFVFMNWESACNYLDLLLRAVEVTSEPYVLK